MDFYKSWQSIVIILIVQYFSVCTGKYFSSRNIILNFVHAADFQKKASSLHKQDWDSIVYTQLWPESACLERNITHEFHCKIFPNVTSWTIHGLWPNKVNTMGPVFCNDSAHFNLRSISPIMDNLLMSWPNLFTDTPIDSFWEHEWRKHGTCAMTLPALNSELRYFSMGLDLQHFYNISKIFSSVGIKPTTGKGYQVSDLESVLGNFLHSKKAFKMMCYNYPNNDAQMLAQVEVCLDKKFDSIDCLPRHTRNALWSGTIFPCHNKSSVFLLPIRPTAY